MKRCGACAATKPLTEFHRNRTKADERCVICKACAKSRTAAWQRDHPGHSKRWRAAHPEQARGHSRWYRLRNAVRVLDLDRARREANREQYRAAVKAWWKAHPEKRRAKQARRDAALLRALPPWADVRAIIEVYALAERCSQDTGVPHQVDHIVPLRSPLVCGLHVDWNLQAIPAISNAIKGNRFWPDMPGVAQSGQ